MPIHLCELLIQDMPQRQATHARQRGGGPAEMLGQSLPLAAAVGIDRALLTCDVGNIGSMKVIERCGGIFESMTNDPAYEIQKLRY